MHVLCTRRSLNSVTIISQNFFLRSHPGPGIAHSASVGGSIAMQQIDIEYFGHRFVVLLQCPELPHTFFVCSAHAGADPW